MKQLVTILAIALLLPIGGEMAVFAQDKKADQERRKSAPSSSSYRENSRQQDVMNALKRANLKPYPSIKRSVEKSLNGRIVSQQLLRSSKHGWIYQLRVALDSGRVRYVEVDAKTGRVLKVK